MDSASGEKVLRRFYRMAASVGSDFLDDRALHDVINMPETARYVFRYYASRDQSDALLELFTRYAEAGENLYEAVEAWFWEACLVVDADSDSEKRVVAAARSFVRGTFPGQTDRPMGKVGALLCLYWFSDNVDDILTLFSTEPARSLPAPVARAWLAVVAATAPDNLSSIQRALVGHPNDDVAKLSMFLDDLRAGSVARLGYYKRLRQLWASREKHYDARAWLQLELMSTAPPSGAQKSAIQDLKYFSGRARTKQDRRVLARIEARVAGGRVAD